MLSFIRGCVGRFPLHGPRRIPSPRVMQHLSSLRAAGETEAEVKAPLTSETDPSDFKVVKIEEAGEEAWSGVAQVDANESRVPPWISTSVLAVGDTAVYALFATIGRLSHGEDLSIGAIAGTALPFLIGWYASAALLDGYGENAKSGKVGLAARTAFQCWLLATPLGLGLHGLAVGHVPPLPFVVVVSGFTFMMMMSWRVGYAAVTPSKASGKESEAERRGNPFEFLNFLNSIVRRCVHVQLFVELCFSVGDSDQDSGS